MPSRVRPSLLPTAPLSRRVSSIGPVVWYTPSFLFYKLLLVGVWRACQ